MPRISVRRFITIIFLKVLSKHIHLQTRGVVGVLLCLAMQNLKQWSETPGYRRQSVPVADLWMVRGWLPQKLQMAGSVSGKATRVFFGWPLRGMLGAEGRIPALGFVHGYHQFSGAGSLVIWKTKPGCGTKPFGVTEADSWEHGCMFNPAFPHSRVVGPWGNLCLTQIPPLPGSHPFSSYLEGCAGCERWLAALGNLSWHIK